MGWNQSPFELPKTFIPSEGSLRKQAPWGPLDSLSYLIYLFENENESSNFELAIHLFQTPKIFYVRMEGLDEWK